MEGCTVVDGMVLVQDIRVQPAVHAFAWATCTERATATKQDLQCREGIDVVILHREAFKGNIDVCEWQVIPRDVQLASSVDCLCGCQLCACLGKLPIRGMTRSKLGCG